MEKKYMALVGAILIIVAYYLIDFFTEFLFIFAIGDKIEYGIGNFLYLATSEMIRIVVFAGILFTLNKRKNDAKKEIRRQDKIVFIILTVIIPIALMMISKAICNHIGCEYETNNNLELGDWVCVFLTPFSEEITFRGCMISLARKNNLNEKVMIVASSMVWTILHSYNIIIRISIFFTGILYSMIYSKTDRLKYNIISHFIWNLITIMGY